MGYVAIWSKHHVCNNVLAIGIYPSQMKNLLDNNLYVDISLLSSNRSNLIHIHHCLNGDEPLILFGTISRKKWFLSSVSAFIAFGFVAAVIVFKLIGIEKLPPKRAVS